MVISDKIENQILIVINEVLVNSMQEETVIFSYMFTMNCWMYASAREEVLLETPRR